MTKIKAFARNKLIELLREDVYKTELARLKKEIIRQKEKNELARKQRDDARKQRDDARQQRNEARRQRQETAREAKKMAARIDSGGSSKKSNYLSELKDSYTRYEEVKYHNPELANVSLAIQEMDQGVQAPVFYKVFPERQTPPESVAFVTVANNVFVPGLAVLLASFLDVYPDFSSDVIVFHDGSISEFSKKWLAGIYSKVSFREPDMSWLSDIPQDSGNRKRIGILGYMSVMALELEQYERVVVLDSDTALVDDISMFWTGKDVPLGSTSEPLPVDSEHIFACHDYGARPWAAITLATGKPIINSGIISIPRRYMSARDQEDIRNLVLRNGDKVCPLLDRFADQKAWNRFIDERDTSILPINFNCNIKFLDQNRGGDTSFVRLIHFAGYKPWFHKDYMDGDLIPESEGTAIRPSVWRDLCRTKLGRVRQRRYQAEISRPGYFDRKATDRLIDHKPTCVFIGNGPSLKETDLMRFEGLETFAFNWFILHDEFDTVKPDNLVLGSHMFFGGWQTQTPKIPDEYLDALLSKTWRPRIWSSFYFKEYFDLTGLSETFDIRYVLFEKPHKEFVDATGSSNLTVDGFTHDGRTGVLSVALPVAVRQGYNQIALVGCDSNYNQGPTTDSNYFYDAARHVSKETRKDSLTKTWVNDGPGYFAYTRSHESLKRRGGGFIDYTLNGSLPLPKGDIHSL
jgi:lipopolysaccharide biosynthesis glycosyltransferase